MSSSHTASPLDLLQQRTKLEADTSESAIARAETDFGGLCHGRARGVVRPANARCLPDVVRSAREYGLKLTIRGKGLSQSGQSVADESLLVDLSQCDAIRAPDLAKQTITCEPGATWRGVLARAAASGLGPKVLPLNLDLSVGGTLSAGGFGSTSHRYGVAVSHVTSAEVVLGTGEVVQCGPSIQRPIFDAVLSGLGRCGIIMNAELELVPVPRTIRTFFLLYEKLDLLLEDQQRIASEGRAAHLEAFCSASVQGLYRGPTGRRQPLVHWLFGLHLGIGYQAEPPNPDLALKSLRHSQLLHVEDTDYLEHAARYDSRFHMMRLTGAWEQIHPWFEALLPVAEAPKIIAQALSSLPMFFGDGHRILLISGNTDRPASLAFPSGDWAVGFTVLPTGIPSVFRNAALESLERLDDIVRQAGGRRYPSGWLFHTDSDGWRSHYGHSYSALLQAQREYDPDVVFQSWLGGPRPRPTSAADMRHR
jgi:cytokinin dehydrogenase